MVKKIVLTVIAMIVIFLGYVALKPAPPEISREISIAAPAEKIFPYVNNRSLVNSWNPWLLQDPDARITLSGPEEGVGSKTSWAEGKTLGTGSATVIESVPNERVIVKLEYQKPFEMTQEAAFLLMPAGNNTVVTWKVNGQSTFMCRLMGTFMNMDKLVGDTFYKGLTDLKTRVEKI